MVSSNNIGIDPFKLEMDEVRIGYDADFREFSGDTRYIVRVQPYYKDHDYLKYEAARKEFEVVSGLRFIPHWNVLGKAVLPADRYEDSDEKTVQPAMFHVVRRVNGINVIDDEHHSASAVPQAEAAKLAEGLFNYIIHAYKNGLPNLFEIRPSQFMYGTVEGDKKPQLYFVDIDYVPETKTDEVDLVESLDYIYGYISDYAVDISFRPVVTSMFNFLQDPSIREKIEQVREAYPNVLQTVEGRLSEYIKSLEQANDNS